MEMARLSRLQKYRDLASHPQRVRDLMQVAGAVGVIAVDRQHVDGDVQHEGPAGGRGLGDGGPPRHLVGNVDVQNREIGMVRNRTSEAFNKFAM
jgi:hypothetical protein